jgi:hypothetical protein
VYLLTLVAHLLLVALVPRTLARARFPRLGLLLQPRPIVARSPNCSARHRRLCLRCNLAFWAVPAKSRRRLQQHRWYRRLHQGWTLVLNQLHQLPLPLPLLTTAPALALRIPGPAVDHVRTPTYVRTDPTNSHVLSPGFFLHSAQACSCCEALQYP